MILKIMVPFSIYGLISFFQPYTFALLPVCYSDSCWNYFHKYYHYQYSYCSMNTVNIIMYVSIRALEIAAVLVMMFRIRNVKEELNIRNELITIFVLVIVSSLIYAIPLAIYPDWLTNHIIEYERLFFALTLLKNYLRLLISVLYCIKMLRKSNFSCP